MLSKIKKIVPDSLKHQYKVFTHKGNKYICPFCCYTSKDLALIGLNFPVLKEKKIIGGSKRFAGCFNCGSTDRERLIYIYLKETLHLFSSHKNKSILHIAPEKNLSKLLLNFGFKEYVAGDLFTEGYSYPAHVKNINVLHIPYPDDHFDLVICNHVLEHIPTYRAAMKEIYRVLKKEGQAILQVPISKNSSYTFEDFSVTDPKQREIVFGQKDHIRIYGQDYPKRLEGSGFKVQRINISKEYLQFGLNTDEDIFIGKK